MKYVFDIETDGFLNQCTKVHCIVLKNIDTGEILKYDNEFNNMTCAEVHTEWWIFDKTPAYVYSFASYHIDNGEIEFGDRNVYPRSVVKKMIRI